MRTRSQFYLWLIILAVAAIAGACAGEWAKNRYTSKHRNRKEAGIGLVVLGDENFDFGNVRQNESLNHVFTLANAASNDIRIVEYRSSCPCTVLSNVKGSVLHPGDTLGLPVSIRTGTGEGSIRGSVSLYCQSSTEEGTKEGSLTLGLDGTIVTEYRIHPNEIDFGEIHSLSPVLQLARLFATSDLSVRILRIESNAKVFIAQQVAPPPGEDGQYIEVRFTGVGLLRESFMTGIITIHTDNRRLPSKQILCKVKYVPPVQVIPSSIVIDSDQRGDISERVTVRTTNPAEVSVDNREPYFSVISQKSDRKKTVHYLDVVVRDRNYVGFTVDVKIDLKYPDDTFGAEVATVVIPVYRLAQREGVGR